MKHSWKGEPHRTTYLTTRTCSKCAVQKVTHHDARLPWIDFWRDGACLGTKTPPCEPIAEALDAAA